MDAGSDKLDHKSAKHPQKKPVPEEGMELHYQLCHVTVVKYLVKMLGHAARK